MMRLLLLLGGLWLASWPVLAQDSLVSRVSARPAAATDTTVALHRLFAARRKRQHLLVGGTTTVLVTTTAVLAATQPAALLGINSSNSLAPPVMPIAAGALATLLEALLLGGWGHKREQQVLAAWTAQHQLPRWLRRRLKAAYFRPPPGQHATN